MPPSRRLADLEELIETNYQKLAKFQKRLDRTASVREEFDIEGDIPKIRKAIRDYEAEYWELLAQEARTCEVAEVDASYAIVEVVQEVELIENKLSANYPDQFMRLLLEIREKLNEPGQPAAAKAKLALPLVPGILSYEVELDTESSLRRAFQPIKRLFRGAIEKK
ncbi:MAG TPA: hypothetical protein V6D26_00150 [Stenomitos sp.]